MAVLNPYNYKNPQGMIKVPKINRTFSNSGSSNTIKQTKPMNKDLSTQYLERKVMTSTPQELTLMLYEGAVKFIKQAQVYNSQKNIEKTSNAILRAHAIYTELSSTLDMDYEISKELEALYDYMLSGLTRANLKKDGKMLEELLYLAEDFCDMWRDAMKAAKKSK